MLNFLDHRIAGTCYSHRSRAFHIRYLAWQYMRFLEVTEGYRPEKTRDMPPLAFAFTGMEDSIKIFDEPVPEAGYRRSIPPRSFRDTRFEELLQKHDAGSLPPGMELVEGAFPHDGNSQVYIRVLLKEVGEVRKAVYAASCIR